jgi:ABC-type multidrug transport system ATPase subunit
MKTLSFNSFGVSRGNRKFFDLNTDEDQVSFDSGLHLLLAPNGLGKSTFLQACAGILPDSKGELIFEQATVSNRKSIYYLSEYLTLPKFITGQEWASSFGTPDLVWVEAFGLKEVWLKYLGQMSQGERRKIMWLSADFSQKPILLLDEPLDGLDIRAIATARLMIKKWKAEGRVVLMVAHQTAEVMDLAIEAWIAEGKKWCRWSSYFKSAFDTQSPNQIRERLLAHYK